MLVKGYQLNVGRITKESILDYARGIFTGNIPHLDHTFVHQGGVKFNEDEEERCPNLSLLLESSKLQWIVRREREEISPPEREKGQK